MLNIPGSELIFWSKNLEVSGSESGVSSKKVEISSSEGEEWGLEDNRFCLKAKVLCVEAGIGQTAE
ncbi:MAG: hypothetical protein HC769_29390 [Cyanobacteria bacterium CRU_2_1]|nr:hypothetical protein [Cyanobacteria bacterium RU_5_0]NJR62552.1 hypothetical protein [Cyanobacteria bacterium CRU_2_1]